MKPHREVLTHGIQILHDENSEEVENPDGHLEESSSEIIEDYDETPTGKRQRKRLKISENQTKYNDKMVQQSQKKAAKK